ncbi:MAG: twin-arginine translocase TatA/TatE family subunit [Chloroflexota bacterium]|nr:twin-arginine translocase TatA/TatE family subunit [Chloroflexota bacterium]
MIPGFHGADLIVILVVALLVFGPKRLPEMGAAVGKSIKEFRKGMNELTAHPSNPKEELVDEPMIPANSEIHRLSNIPVESELTRRTTVNTPVESTMVHSETISEPGVVEHRGE